MAPRPATGRSPGTRSTGSYASATAWRGMRSPKTRLEPIHSGLNVQLRFRHEFRALRNEAEAFLGLVAHELLDDFFGRLAFAVLQCDAQERALGGVHRGFLELARHHLAKALETADLDLAAARKLGLE